MQPAPALRAPTSSRPLRRRVAGALAALSIAASAGSGFAQRIWYELSDISPPAMLCTQDVIFGFGSMSPTGAYAGFIYDQFIPSPDYAFVRQLEGPHAIIPLRGVFSDGGRGFAMNAQGHVVGNGYLPDPLDPTRIAPRAWYYDGKELVLLTADLPETDSHAKDINARNEVVGYYDGPSGARAFVWTPEQGRRLLPERPGWCCSLAWTNADSGWIAGVSRSARRQYPVVWVDGQIHALPLPPGHSGGFVYDIADCEGEEGVRAYVVGWSDYEGDYVALFGLFEPTTFPILWEVERSPEGIVTTSYRILPSLPGDRGGGAGAVNGRGDVLGWSADPRGFTDGALWRNGRVYRTYDLYSHEPQWTLGGHKLTDTGQIWGTGFEVAERAERPYVLTPADLELGGPVPGYAGRTNSMEVRYLQPGQEVRIYYSTYLNVDGYTRLSNECGTMLLGLRDPVLLGAATADAHGRAVIEAHVPRSMRGRHLKFQAAAADTCDVSNRVEWEFQ